MLPIPVEIARASSAASNSGPATRESCTTPTSGSTRRRRRARLDEADPGPGYDGLIARSATYPDGHFLGWTPGQVAPLLPDDLAWRLDKNTDLVVELHMQPSGKAEQVAPSIGLYFGDTAPTRTPAMLRLGRQDIDIPAGDAHYTVTDSYTLPVDVEVEAVQPHAHYRARDVRGEATLPDGSKKPLIDIADWDFRWQHVYRFVTPLRLPERDAAVDALHLRQLRRRTRAIRSGRRRAPAGDSGRQRRWATSGCRCCRATTTISISSAAISGRRSPPKTSRGTKRRSRSTPATRRCTTMWRCCIWSWARSDGAIAHFTTSLALKPQSAVAHYNLGTALTVARRLDEAAAEYREALRIDPAYANAHNNLGNVLLAQTPVRRRRFANSRKSCACSRTPRPRARTSPPAYAAAGRQPPR